ncbi:hypothetical protein [Bacteroides uniformis]|uniref:hypothetical protein n=1 Tax=Bacteroides uniformis TaxID=820 RepID=UPI001C3048F7|nr:hypothetical protein [Bacteroides uniformis]
MAEKVKQYRHPDDPITLDELKGFLWAAATHLRGQIDAAGYKDLSSTYKCNFLGADNKQ